MLVLSLYYSLGCSWKKLNLALVLSVISQFPGMYPVLEFQKLKMSGVMTCSKGEK